MRMTAAQNKVAHSDYRLCRLYFLTAIFAATINWVEFISVIKTAKRRATLAIPSLAIS